MTDTHNDLVLAVQVRQVDPPQFVAEDLGDLTDGQEWGGEQCDSCGCCAYTIERDPNFPSTNHVVRWRVRCSGDPALAEEYAAQGADAAQVEAVRKGCGATYHLRWLRSSEVAF